jgi:hypothetical protein
MKFWVATVMSVLAATQVLAQEPSSPLVTIPKPVTCMAAKTFGTLVEAEKLKGIEVGVSRAGVTGSVWSNGTDTYFVDKKDENVCVVGVYTVGGEEKKPEAPKKDL